MRSRNKTLVVFASFGAVVVAFAFTPTIPLSRRSTLCSINGFFSKTRLYESVEKESGQLSEITSNNATVVAVQEAYINAKITTMKLEEHRPLGCTVEESVDTINDPSVVFISKIVEGGHAEKAGLEVGDVLIGVSGFFGDMTPVWQSGVEMIKILVAAVADEVPLMLQIARGTGVMERHEASIVDLCQTPGASDKQVEDCVVEFLASGYDTSVSEEEENGEECSLEDDEADCMIDSMLNLWADELPPPPTTSGITDTSGENAQSKPKPWSSRSSPSGTFVRDPVTGEMRNIDA